MEVPACLFYGICDTMKRIILITGGQRSGKSVTAERMALSMSDNPVYLATAHIWDDEFRKRVEIHQQRRGPQWTNIEEEKDPFFAEPKTMSAPISEPVAEQFEMPANITVLKKLISQLPSGVSRHTGAQIIKQTMEALGISMKSVLQDAQQVQENLKVSARACQASIQEYKKQILALEKQSQSYQKQYSALNDLISLFIQTTK